MIANGRAAEVLGEPGVEVDKYIRNYRIPNIAK